MSTMTLFTLAAALSTVAGGGTFPEVSPRWIRRAVLAVFVLGIAGMIVASVRDDVDAALTAGLITAVGVVCLLLITAVGGPAAFAAPPPPDEAAAEDLERRVQDLVARGAEEADVRSLVRAAARFYRRQG
jgi:hypothetical protein